MVGIREALAEPREGKRVEVKGWVYRHRKLGEEKIFIVVRDGWGILQGVVRKGSPVWEKAENLYIESSIIMRGSLRKDERAPGGWEVDVEELEVISLGEPFPIGRDLSEEFLLDVRHLWLRSRKMNAVLRLRHHALNYMREFLEEKGFVEIHPPIITQAGAEGGADMFEIDYFGEKAYLTQSSQLYVEAAIYSVERAYALAPSFRAEKSRTRRHLAEFWHLEPEAAFVRHEENMALQEELVSYVIGKLVKGHRELFEVLSTGEEWMGMLEKVRPPFPRLTYEEAVEKVNELGGKMSYGEDFGADEEALLTSIYEVPIFITNFPLEIKAFYMAEDPKRPGTALNDDMLAPKGHGEIIGGSERIWKYDELVERMKAQGIPLEPYQWYIDLRKYGSVPHSGFGLGVERFIKYVANLSHVRDAIPFPRTMSRVRP